MKLLRIALIVVALLAAVASAFLAKGMLSEEQVAAVPPPVVKSTKVLVAAKDISVGSSVGADTLEWQDWPEGAVSSRYVTRSAAPQAKTDFVGATARAVIVAGEPILKGKLIKAGEGGFMSAILPSGMRAVSVRISPETGAGGFILPNDRVDVILTRRQSTAGKESLASETILTNVRVLAIDQTLRSENADKDDQVAIGKTATLALKPAQAEHLALSVASGEISLALRSMADADPSRADDDLSDFAGAGGSITVIRYGVSSRVSARK